MKNIFLIFVLLISVSSDVIVNKDIITDTVFTLSNSPYFITSDIRVIKNLKIEPGVVLKISPKVKISVEGVLTANGEPNNRIVFTKVNNSNTFMTGSSLRLVNGLEVRQGNLQIKYQGIWRPICSQNREWSANDIVVACKELGFMKGNFSLYRRAENDTTHMLLLNPNCNGNETQLSKCPGLKNASIGSAVCNLQELVGLHCWGASEDVFKENWAGITFYNSSIAETIISTDNTRLNVSRSQLNYVDILYGGVNITNHRIAALSGSPYPPQLSNIRLAFNAYDAINFTDIRGPALISNSLVEQNFGHGMNITSSTGYVYLTNVTSRLNAGAGGYIELTTKHWAEETPELVDLSKKICGEGVITSSPMFPFILVTEHLTSSYMSNDICSLPITTDKRNQIISVKPLEAIRDPSAEANITIIDSSTSKVLAIWNFTNFNNLSKFSPRDRLYYGPLYQGISSTSGSILIKYSWRKDPSQKICSYLRQCFRGLFQISVGETTNPEVIVKNSLFQSNIQHGLRIENLGLYAQILNSTFKDNEFGAGLSVVNGSSDVLVHNCLFENNDRTGLNITMSGGTRIVNSSIFLNNQGHGLDIWNPTWLMTRYNPNPIENIIFLSKFQNNLWNGIRFYNSSSFMNILVNYSYFIDNKKNGIEMVSTIVNQNLLLTNFSVGFSTFQNNNWHGVMISPVGQMTGRIFNCSFFGHTNGGTIFIDNGINFDEQRLIYRHLPVDYSINYNEFYQNSGPFVVSVRLTENSIKQKCSILLNKFFDNKILATKNSLNPRSYATAVVVIGSSNIQFIRNYIRNPDSNIEIATQLIAADKSINASWNYWGSFQDFNLQTWEQIHGFIFNRIFDHESRYSLAKVNYFPVLKEPFLLSNIFSDNDPKYRHEFRVGTNLEIGGMIDINLKQNIILEANSLPYRVTKDIFVPQGASLKLQPGVQLEFENSIGFFVQGSVDMQGTPDKPIKMFMKSQDYINSMNANLQIITQYQLNYSNNNLSLINSTIINKNLKSLQGILRVNINGIWGLVCDNQFDIIAARIACSAFGLVAHPLDWQVPAFKKIGNVFNDPVIISTLRCQSWMTKFDQCEFDSITEHVCSAGAVNLRCHKPGWAGMQMSLTNEKSYLAQIQIENFGLLDYYFNQFIPALQIDFNKHYLKDISISRGLSDGLLIYQNDLLSFSEIINLNSTNNFGSGVITKTPWVTFNQCKFINNKFSGFKFDPGFSEEELFNFRAAMLKTLNMMTPNSDGVTYLSIHTTGIEVLYMPVGYVHEQKTYWVELKASDPNIQQQLLVTLIDFNPDFGVENVTIYDNSYETVKSQLTNPTLKLGSSITWSIPNDLTRFPVISNGKYLTVRIVVNGTISGRLSFIVQAESFIDLWNKNIISRNSTTANGMMYYFPTKLVIANSDLSNNGIGATITHYNTATDSQNRSYTKRQSRLYIDIKNVLFYNNSQLALHIPSVSPFASDFYFPTYGDSKDIESTARVSRIHYNINNCNFTNNMNIILAEHNHVPFSNNVWNYAVTNNQFNSNFGGINIQMPFVSTRFDWRYLPNIDHSIDFLSNEFINNINFQYIIDGYYLRFKVNNNRFSNNNCIKQGLLSMQGMEKLFNISFNLINNNYNCQFMIESVSDSQTEFANSIIGYIGYNNIVNNSCSQSNYEITYTITCYTIGVFGNQNVTVNRNILDNKNKFKYELVAGMITNQMSNKFDATENYWGTVDINTIRSLIFDVNTWNNFAEVVFARFLLDNNMLTGKVYTSKIEIISVNMDFSRLGGQISKNLFLPSRPQPYIVQSDLTVLPGVEFRIDSGVTLEFMPNVGILVFGKLIARGVSYRPIIMRPYQSNNMNTNQRFKRAAVPTNTPKKIRLIGGKLPDEGFVQFFNESLQRWDYMCDDQFSKQVGSVLCREMGLTSTNPRIRRSYLVDFQLYGYDNPFVIKYIWNTRYACRGYESDINDCVKRFNYNAFQCLIRREFVFLRCEKDFLNKNESYWGNIRIILPGIEQVGKVDGNDRSYLEHINITKAGVLHGELVSAIQTTHAYPLFKFVSIEKCAWNGIDVIAPRVYVQIANSSFQDNVGYGAAITLLNPDSTDPVSTTKQLIPMSLSPIPSSVLGLINMCDLVKDMYITNRLLLYYRYSYRTIACTKLIRSAIPNKQIAVRFLQLNLFYDPFTKNSIEIYNGDVFNSTELLTIINAKPLWNDDEANGFLTSFTVPPYVIRSGYDILGLHLYASPASEDYGFIMEVITVPLSPDITFADINQYTLHRIAESSFIRNQGGAVRISAVGEMNPVIDVYYNRFIDNGGSPMLNLTAVPVTLIRLQNCREVNVANNYYSLNRGGSELFLYSTGINKAIQVNFTNNVLVNTSYSSCLKMIGNSLSTARVERNFIVNNDCENRDVIKIQDIIMNPFAYNYINNNRGSVMVNISGEETISTKSQYLWNGFYDNLSINYTRATTVFCYNTKNLFKYNYFRNLRNDFELVVGNQTIMKEAPIDPGNNCPLARECPTGWTVMLERNSCVCYRPDVIDATENWWGESPIFFVRGRIWDQTDDKYIIPVNFNSSFKTNETVLGGGIYCPPTWTYYDNNCYFYFGAPLNYGEAREFCQTNIDAILADSRNIVEWMGKFIATWQNNYYWINRDSWNTRAWVHSYIPFGGRCPAIRSNWLEGFQCDQNVQYICQKSPYGVYKSIQIEILIGLIFVFIIFIIILILLLILWSRNSKRRHKAFLIRCTELKHHFEKESQALLDPRVDLNWNDDNISGFGGSSRASVSNIVSRGTVSSTIKSGITSSGRSKYDDDVMKMRRNTLTDMKEAINRPKSTVDFSDNNYNPRRDLEIPTQMVNPKKTRYDPHNKPKTSTLTSKFSGASTEALYVNAPPGSQLKLSQPDVPQLFKSADSRSTLQLPTNNRGDDPSRMNTMVDPLLDPNIMTRNKPIMVRSTPNQPSFSTNDSFNSSATSRNKDTSALIQNPDRMKPTKSKPHSKSGSRHQILSSESEI